MTMNHKQYTNIVFTFLFGGLIVILVSLISDHVSNNIAALLWAFPFTVIPTLCYFYLQNKSSKHISDFLLKIMFSVCLLFFNILILYYVYKLTNNLLISLAISCLIYVMFSCCYIYYEQ